VGDEDVGELQLRLEILQQVENLGLNGYVQAETASSQTISFGLQASERAMPIRWR
jgi:hypothetical protein